jgi:hypothetical protein
MAMNFVTFNQDYSHLAVGTTRGFRIFTTDPFAKCFETREDNIAILEMLFSTSLVALILSPRRLQIKNTKVRHGNLLWSTMLTHGISAQFDNLRTYLPDYRPSRAPQSEETGHSSRGPDLSLRYSDHEAALHNRNISKSHG